MPYQIIAVSLCRIRNARVDPMFDCSRQRCNNDALRRGGRLAWFSFHRKLPTHQSMSKRVGSDQSKIACQGWKQYISHSHSRPSKQRVSAKVNPVDVQYNDARQQCHIFSLICSWPSLRIYLIGGTLVGSLPGSCEALSLSSLSER